MSDEKSNTIRALTEALVRAQAGMAALSVLAICKGATMKDISETLARTRRTLDGAVPQQEMDPAESTAPMDRDAPEFRRDGRPTVIVQPLSMRELVDREKVS